MAGSTVLVTGSAGRIGRAAVRELKARGHTVRGFDRVPTPGLADSLVGDITDGAAVRRAAQGVQALVHLAATPDDDDFLTQLLPNNIVGVYHVMEAAREAGVRRVILASSGQVVWCQRFTGPLPIGTDVQPTPRGWYAATKVFQEAAGRVYAEAHGLSVVAARLGWCPRNRDHIEELRERRLGEGRLPQPRRRRPLLRLRRRGTRRHPLRRGLRLQPAAEPGILRHRRGAGPARLRAARPVAAGDRGDYGMKNRTRMKRMRRINTDLIRANPSHPLHPCSISG